MTENKKGRATATPKDFFNPNSTTKPLIAFIVGVGRAKRAVGNCSSKRKKQGRIDPLLLAHLLVLALLALLIWGGAA